MMREYIRGIYRLLWPFFFRKRNYKLFLRRTFHELDESIHSIMCAVDVLPNNILPIPIKAPFGKKMLVIAPHQDDEIIGCGGSLILHLMNKGRANVLFVQDGGDEHGAEGISREEMIKIREQEALSVSRKLNLSEPGFLRFPYLDDDSFDQVYKEFEKQINQIKPDSIFIPFFLDYNEDHKFVNLALAKVLKKSKRNVKIYCYEVWGLTIPNVIVNIDSVIDEKLELLSYYKSQIVGTDYVNCVKGLNMYHSRHYSVGKCSHAERFFEINKDDYITVLEKIYNKTF